MEYKASVDDLLQWLSEKPRTMGWNCIVAYDRVKTNTVLLQEYIERFTTGHYLDPITTEIETTEGTVELIYDYIIDAGRLSFENAVISDSMARLTMRIIGGSQISLELVDGIPHVAKIKSIDALDGPLLYMDIKLEATQGKITDEGLVFLDLYKAFNVRLTFAATDHERELGGDFFDWYFKNEIERDQQIHVLNQIMAGPNQYLVPEEFHIRTHAAPGGRDPRSAVYGSGSVLVFITTKDQENGELVVEDEDLHYLIPEGHSATMLLGNEFLMSKIMSEGCRAMANDQAEFTFELMGKENEFVDYLAVRGGEAGSLSSVPLVEGFRKFQVYHAFPMSGSAAILLCKFAEGKVLLNWVASTPLRASLETVEGVRSEHPLPWSWNIARPYEFRQIAGTDSLKLVVDPIGDVTTFQLLAGENANIPEIFSRFDEVQKVVPNYLLESIRYHMDLLAESASYIDIFRLNSILFKGENVVKLASAVLPGDLAAFGNISPSLTRFAITPLESDIGPGQKRQFATEPEMEGVTWSVEKVPGSSDAVGSIDARGEYTAPALSEISGSYTRIRVTAQVGEYRQSALINVVTRAINVNPMVMTCPVGTQTGREMSAGALGGGVLTWKIADPSSGATIKPSTITFGDHNYRPGPRLEDVNVTVDEVVVTSALNGVSQSCPVVVVHNPGTLIIEYEDIGNPDKLQMRARFQGNLLPIDEPFEWKVIAGSGQIDEVTGVFTLDPEGQHKFAVITGIVDFAPGWVMKGFVILPIPLLPMPEALRVQRVHLQRNLPRE